jgi:putative flippase GtrA
LAAAITVFGVETQKTQAFWPVTSLQAQIGHHMPAMPYVLAPSLARPGLLPSRVRHSARAARLYRDLANYLVFGGIAAAANLMTGWLLYQEFTALALPYWLATSIGAACGLLVNFALNHAYFGFSERSALRQFATFVIVSGIGVALTGALAQALLVPSQLILDQHLAGIHVAPKFAAHVTAVGLVVLYSFPAHRFISFNVGFCARMRQLLRRGVQ